MPQRVVDALKANAHRKDYLPVRGLADLRKAVADYHRRRDGLDAHADDILIGPGSKQLMFLLQLTYDADVLLPSPSWVSYEPQATIIGRKVRWLQTTSENGWRVTPAEIDKACSEDRSRAKLLILNSPGNPTGLTFSPSELEQLARVARSHELLILSDEIYGELDHAGTHESIAKYYPEGTIVSSGLSKWCAAGGWRLGTFCFPADLRPLLDAMAAVASETHSSASAPIQYAAVTAFNGGGDIDRYIMQSRRILRAVGRLAAARLQVAGIDVHSPQGGFYLFPRFKSRRDVSTSAELCERLLNDTGVAMLPGSDFGRPETELTCRIAYVDFDGGRSLDAAESVPGEHELSEDFVTRHCGAVVEAIDLVAGWAR